MHLCVFFPPSFSNADQSRTCSGCIQSSRLLCWGLLQSSVGLLKPWQKNLEVLTFQKSFSRTKQDKTAQKRYLTREKNKAPKRQPKGFGFSFFFFFFQGTRSNKTFFFLKNFCFFLPPLFLSSLVSLLYLGQRNSLLSKISIFCLKDTGGHATGCYSCTHPCAISQL